MNAVKKVEQHPTPEAIVIPTREVTVSILMEDGRLTFGLDKDVKSLSYTPTMEVQILNALVGATGFSVPVKISDVLQMIEKHNALDELYNRIDRQADFSSLTVYDVMHPELVKVTNQYNEGTITFRQWLNWVLVFVPKLDKNELMYVGTIIHTFMDFSSKQLREIDKVCGANPEEVPDLVNALLNQIEE